jgi:hypothetical protein
MLCFLPLALLAGLLAGLLAMAPLLLLLLL